MLDIIYLIRDTIDAIISIKVKEQIQLLMKSKNSFNNYHREYEELLRQEEAEIRKHISTQHQLKIQIEKMQEKIELFEREKNVSIINYL